MDEMRGFRELYEERLGPHLQGISKDIVDLTYKLLKGVGKKHVVVFIGRGANPFYVAAVKLGPAMGLDKSNTKLFPGGKFLRSLDQENTEGVEAYIKKLDFSGKKKVFVVDTGIYGSQVKPLSSIIRKVHPFLKVEGKAD